MAEYIKRDQVFALAVPIKGCCSKMISSWDVVHIPAADVFEVVRCKECIHYTPCEGGKSLCCWHGIAIVENDFCSDGERRANDVY